VVAVRAAVGEATNRARGSSDHTCFASSLVWSAAILRGLLFCSNGDFCSKHVTDCCSVLYRGLRTVDSRKLLALSGHGGEARPAGLASYAICAVVASVYLTEF